MMTFEEFSLRMFELNPDANPIHVQDGWVWQVCQAIKKGSMLSNRVLESHPEVRFDKDGNAYSVFGPGY